MVDEAEQISLPKLIGVEGNEDKMVFDAIVEHFGLDDVQVISYEGKDLLSGWLGNVVKDDYFQEHVLFLGIVRDNDDNPKAAFQSVCSALKKYGFPIPKKPTEPVGDNPKINVLLIPRTEKEGELEDLCLESLQDEAAMACVEDYFICLDNIGIQDLSKIAKRKVLVYLQSVGEPGRGLGVSAMLGEFDWNNPVFEDIRTFLQG